MILKQKRSASLKQNFTWIFLGNLISSGCQWFFFSLIAKMTNPAVLGKYALALAVAGPLTMIANFNIGVMLVTDTERRHRFEAYRMARMMLIGIGFVLLLVICGASRFTADVTAVCLMVGLSQGLDCLSELYYSLMLRSERMSCVAISLIARGLLSVTTSGLVLFLTHNLIWAVCAMVACRLAVVLGYDLSMRTKCDNTSGGGLRKEDLRTAYRIARTALPLTTVTVMASLSINTPRYFIEKYCGHYELGIFAAMWSLVTAGNTIAMALGQALFPRLSRLYAAGEIAAYRKLTLQAAATGMGLGVAGILTAFIFGGFILRVLYRPEYAEAHRLFLGVMAAGAVLYTVTVLGHAATAAKSFADQAKLMAGVMVTIIVANAYFVPRFGLWGAVMAVATGNIVYVTGMVVVVLRLMDCVAIPEAHPAVLTESV